MHARTHIHAHAPPQHSLARACEGRKAGGGRPKGGHRAQSNASSPRTCSPMHACRPAPAMRAMHACFPMLRSCPPPGPDKVKPSTRRHVALQMPHIKRLVVIKQHGGVQLTIYSISHRRVTPPVNTTGQRPGMTYKSQHEHAPQFKITSNPIFYLGLHIGPQQGPAIRMQMQVAQPLPASQPLRCVISKIPTPSGQRESSAFTSFTVSVHHEPSTAARFGHGMPAPFFVKDLP